MFTWFNKEKDGKVVTAKKKFKADNLNILIDLAERLEKGKPKLEENISILTNIKDPKLKNLNFDALFDVADAMDALDAPRESKTKTESEPKQDITTSDTNIIDLFEDNVNETKGETKDENKGEDTKKEKAEDTGEDASMKSLKESLIQKSIKIQAKDNGTNNGIELSDATMNNPKKSEEAGKILEDESKSKEQKETELKAKGLVTEASLYNQVMDGLFRVAEKVEEETKIEDKVEETKEDKVNDIIDNATDFKTEVEELLNVM